jgi:hypothetical protein
MVTVIDPGPSPAQWAVLVGFAIAIVICWVVGFTSTRTALRRRRPGTTIPGVGIALMLAGLMVLLIGVDVVIAIFEVGESSPVSRWWFVPRTPDVPVVDFLATPAMNLLVIATLVFFLGLPSRTQLVNYVRSFADPTTRVGAVWVTVIVAAGLIGGTVGALMLASWVGGIGAIPGSFIGGFLAAGLVIVIGGQLAQSRRRPDAEGGEAP